MPGESRMHLQQPSQWAGGGGGTFARSGGFGARGPEGDGFQPAHRGGSAVGSGSTGRRGGHEMMALAGGERGYEQVVGMGAAGLGTNVGSDMTGSSRATQRVSDPGGQTAVWGGSGMQHSDIWGGWDGWSMQEKEALGRAASKYGQNDLARLSQEVGTKSAAECQAFLQRELQRMERDELDKRAQLQSELRLHAKAI